MGPEMGPGDMWGSLGWRCLREGSHGALGLNLKLSGCKPLQPLHLEKVEQNPSNGLALFIE